MKCFFLQLLIFIRFLDFLDVVRLLYKHRRLYQFHQILLLCDHQELACTLKDPPRRVDMKEISLICLCLRKNIELSTKPFEDLLLWNRLKPNMTLLSQWMNHINWMCAWEPPGGFRGNPSERLACTASLRSWVKPL